MMHQGPVTFEAIDLVIAAALGIIGALWLMLFYGMV
jgi:hypothetical protein